MVMDVQLYKFVYNLHMNVLFNFPQLKSYCFLFYI